MVRFPHSLRRLDLATSPQATAGGAGLGFVLLEALAVAIGATSVGAGIAFGDHAGIDEFPVGQVDIGGAGRLVVEWAVVVGEDDSLAADHFLKMVAGTSLNFCVGQVGDQSYVGATDFGELSGAAAGGAGTRNLRCAARQHKPPYKALIPGRVPAETFAIDQ